MEYFEDSETLSGACASGKSRKGLVAGIVAGAALIGAGAILIPRLVRRGSDLETSEETIE